MSSSSIFEYLEDSLIEKICGACRCNCYDGCTGMWDCDKCGGDYTDKNCIHYDEWREIITIIDETEQTIEEIAKEADDTDDDGYGDM